MRLRQLWSRENVRVACAVAGVVCVVWNAYAEGSLKATLQARYNQMKVAMASNDGAAIASILSPDFMSVDVSGHSSTGPQMIAEVNDLKPDPDKISVTTLQSINPGANTTAVQQRYDMKTTRTGTDAIAHSVELITISTDTWIRVADEWLLQRTVTDELTVFRDGQLVIHKIKP